MSWFQRDKAISMLNRAVSLDPDNYNYKFNLAVIYDKEGEYQKAMLLYNNVIRNYNESSDSDNSISIRSVRQRVEFIKSQM